MQIDLGTVQPNDPLTHNITLQYDAYGNVLEYYGPMNILYINFEL